MNFFQYGPPTKRTFVNMDLVRKVVVEKYSEETQSLSILVSVGDGVEAELTGDDAAAFLAEFKKFWSQ